MNRGEWYDDPEWRRYVTRIRAELVPMIDQSALTISLAPSGETDVKFAVELGLSIMLDKPIVVVLMPGQEIPEKLRAVADEVLELDMTQPDAPARLAESIFAMTARLESDQS